MHNVGVFYGKFLPPHRGHLNSIIQSATKCKKLYVVVCHNEVEVQQLCSEANCKYMSHKLRTKWLSQELQDFPHIKVIMLDEQSTPVYPNGWDSWVKLLKDAVPEKFDVIFGGELSSVEKHKQYFPDVAYELFDYNREKYPISATEIRYNPLKHWDYILGSARSFFTKRILISGTESCGKSTITKYLAKIYYTSWAVEEGRYYANKYLGGNEDIYTIKDFEHILWDQYKSDNEALDHANKIVFFDTDAVVTEYYAKQYIGETSQTIKDFVTPEKYDYVFFFHPDVAWVDDGTRFLGEQSIRWKLHQEMLNMYVDYGFKNIVEIHGDYNERLNKTIVLVEGILSE